VTPSAVSQRIKALEQRVGQVLVVREKPCTATAAGVPLLRLAAQTALLEAEALAEMGGGDVAAPRIAVPVNADSMATWFTGVFAALDDVLFDVRIEEQDHSARLLREGAVMGAVTTERHPVPGCRAQPLGVMRYVPVANPAYIKRYLPRRVHRACGGRGAVAGMEPRRRAAGHVGAQGVSTRHRQTAAFCNDGRGIRGGGAGRACSCCLESAQRR
jgi:LysR family transcriptional regulator, chromosome initiation inhibitor